MNTAPPGATARATCADGTASEIVTPGKLMLRRNGEGCSVTIAKSGYESQTIALQRKRSAAMIGNVATSTVSAIGGLVVGALVCAVATHSSAAVDTCSLLGGIAGLLLPGWLDARTGAMYMQRPTQIDVTLRPKP